MPYYRNGSNGNYDDADSGIEEVPTRRIRQGDVAPAGFADVDEDITTRPAKRTPLFPDVPIIDSRRPEPQPVPGSGDETKIFRRSGKSGTGAIATGGSRQAENATNKFMEDPVVGWLAVVEGPGRGTSLPLGYGMNSVGRNDGHRVVLDFGDDEISRSNHCTVTYDPRGRKFYLQHGGGKNLTYLNDTPVLSPVELLANQDIQLGQTKLRFVPLCGATFDWQDQEG